MSLITRFPNGINANTDADIFRDLPSPTNPFVLFQDFFDFTVELDFPGGFSTWDTYGVGSVTYPGEPFGVVQLEPSADDVFGIQQDICQAVDFRLGSDLWSRFRFSSPEVDTNIWCGMASAAPLAGGSPPDYLDTWAEACLFHVLTSGEITLEVWENSLLVQTIENLGTMPRDGTYVELAYHFDGDGVIEVAIDGKTVAGELMPVVPQETLHGLMGCRDNSTTGADVAPFDYYYSAQLR